MENNHSTDSNVRPQGADAISRRSFLKRSGGATAATILAFHGLSGRVMAVTGESGYWNVGKSKT